MAATLFSNDDISQVGNFFVTQYYNNLYKHPEEMYMFYKDVSTVTWVDGNIVESATGMMEIHALISAVKFSSIEIKTANFLRSYGDGLMALVSGLVQTGEYERRRKFIQAFFLAPQDSGYYVLNDLFHYVDEEYFCNPDVLAQGSYENLPKPLVASEAVDSYANDGQIGIDEFLVPAYSHGNGNHSNYEYSEHAQQLASQSLIEETISSFSNATISAVPDSSGIAAPVDEPVGEPARHTYASILKAGVSEAEQPVTYQPPVPTPRPSSANLETQQPIRSYPSDEATPAVNVADDFAVDSKSVYVKNVSRYFTEADLEFEFNKYGRVVPDGVAIRSHKETGRYYAFVEYEDSDGADNALQASPVVIDGWEMHVEERRRGTGAASRGRGRGRGGQIGGRGRGRHDGYHSRANGFDHEHHWTNSEWGTSKKNSPRDGRHQSF